MKLKFLVPIFSLFFSFYFSQNINIEVKDTNGKPISEANVQLLKNGRTLDFQKTNDGGFCTFPLSEKGVFSLKFTSVFYKTKLVEIDTNEKLNFEVQLESQITEIQEVEIKSRPKIATAKEDTIAFNLKSVRDGTERTTEDLIKKLPGLNINENGKVTYKGNTVGQVLVEGNEFFGKNHKMATQNISANMIEGIDLWQNFNTINGNRSTAINLKLKDEYRGKVTGNIEGNYGTKNSYLGHANLFKFGKVGNLALIADANNIAKDPINFMDFYEMNTQENIENSGTNNNIDIPSFLNNDGKVKSKANQFGALQYSKSKKNITVTAFSIFNNARLEKLSTSKRIAFDGQPQNFNFLEQKKEDNRGFFGTTQIKIKKTFSDNSFLYYNFGYNPTQDNFNEDINRSSVDYSYYKVQNKTKNSSIGNFLSWNKDILNSKLIFTLSQLNENYTGDLDINSNTQLFLGNTPFLSQRYATNSNKYGFDFYFKNKNQILNFNFHSGISYKKDISDLGEVFSQAVENRTLKNYHYINDLNIYKKLGKFDISASLSSNFITINESNKHYFEKRFSIKFNPGITAISEFGLEYNTKYEIPGLKLLQYNALYTKDLSFYKNTLLTPDLLSKTDNYKFTWHRFNFEKGNNLFFMFMYSKIKPSFTTNITNYGTFSGIENTIGEINNKYIFLFANDMRFSKNYTLKSKLTGMVNKNANFISDNNNFSTIKNLELSQKISTNFRNKPLQFDLGYTFTKSIFEQSFYDITSKQDYLKLSLGIRANINKEWITNVLGEYLIQKTEQNTLKNFLLGGQISYRKEKSNFEYNLLFNNILNLNSFQYINSSTSQLGIDESSITALNGYVLGGLKINL
ncbi:carboxypeptidase-like regulatory domain-containing protein [Chryseobacterium sp. ERMR1:04]|uniref:carboxypeptidase-like regulatory domain-containing protein n=1 Tax=Chryseobacterium sp. ERMR1:04 TaxID=1705393 RepID=UPI0006C8E403|nr:carboxypeptidase-like regulatory domain-containing protein [Chryseobacterium sp. ERMR1:04]KPH11204.1 hypothetical protein AMQ68_17370 [Chryseobacterium sp. ERMR1:04]